MSLRFYIIPKEVVAVADALASAGFEAYLVGGCVRDLLVKNAPKDWDIATNAKPDEIRNVFGEENTVYENDFGTVLVKLKPQISADQDADTHLPRINADSELARIDADIISENLRDDQRTSASVIEVTTFRLEGKYTDKRHPDEVKFANTIEEDLSRRDFTINAIALKYNPNATNFVTNATNEDLVDPYDGQEDINNRIIRTVGEPAARFNEDALRLMRAVRFSVELDFQIDMGTRRAIETHAGLLEMIAKERIRDEFVKILMSPRAAAGIILLEELNLLQYVLPELREGLGVSQNKHHIYTVFEHNVRALDYAVKQNYSFLVRMASLLHDVAKPRTKVGDGPDSTFYNHDRVGGRMAFAALDRLRFGKDFSEDVAHLVRYHMFYYNVGEVTDAGVRRFLRRVGPLTVPDLIKLREADRIGSGVPKAVPYKLRHFLFMIEKVKHDPITPKMLKVDGETVMKTLGIPPSPRVGFILAVLLEEVLDDPGRNSDTYLVSRIKELGVETDAALEKLAREARAKKDVVQADIEDEMKEKFHVQ